MNHVWQMPTLKGSRRLLLLALADNANDAGVCWPAVSTLAKKCNVSERTIHKFLAEMEPVYLVRSSRSGRSTVYQLLTPPDESNPSTPEQGGRGTPEQGGRGGLNKGADRTIIEPSLEPPRERRARKPASGKKRDPLLDDERVKAYREICHLTANAQQRALIVASVTDPARWRGTLVSWMAHGWRPGNVADMIDRYTNPPNERGTNGQATTDRRSAVERASGLTVEDIAPSYLGAAKDLAARCGRDDGGTGSPGSGDRPALVAGSNHGHG